jgi:hypothetical protein
MSLPQEFLQVALKRDQIPAAFLDLAQSKIPQEFPIPLSHSMHICRPEDDLRISF